MHRWHILKKQKNKCKNAFTSLLLANYSAARTPKGIFGRIGNSPGARIRCNLFSVVEEINQHTSTMFRRVHTLKIAALLTPYSAVQLNNLYNCKPQNCDFAISISKSLQLQRHRPTTHSGYIASVIIAVHQKRWYGSPTKLQQLQFPILVCCVVDLVTSCRFLLSVTG